MVAFLIAVIVLLIGVIVYLNLEFYNEKKRFRAKIDAMQQVIAEITRKQSGQKGRIQLSDELNEKLKSSQETLSHDIFGLNYELFDQLSKNNGPKK
jgi:peptidoglycan hydrolase CwlO-like protein